MGNEHGYYDQWYIVIRSTSWHRQRFSSIFKYAGNGVILRVLVVSRVIAADQDYSSVGDALWAVGNTVWCHASCMLDVESGEMWGNAHATHA